MIEKLRTLNAIYQFRGNSPAVQGLKTKQDYLKLAEALCRPLVHYYDSDDSVVHFHERLSSNYSDQEAAFECFSRPLWAMAALVKSGDKELGKTVCAMIKNGVNPQLDTYWGSLRDYAQTIVEIPAICFFLFVNAELFEAEFDAEERKFVINWLQQINHVKVWNNNWHFFPILVNAVLLELRAGGNREVMNAHWEKIDSYYLGDGWYGDGNAAQRDYYIAWAFHFYSLLWTYIDSMMSDTIRETIFKRAEEFASGFKWFFGDDGEAVPFGRSLIYRFAQVAFWSVYKLNELHGQPNGLVKGLISRNLNWWFDKEILKPDGTLNIGYAYQNYFITETYNAEGSPYWAFKVFVLLLIPDESDFWDAALEQYEESDMETYLKGGDFYISRNKGITTIYPYGLSNKDPWPSATGKYHKFAYTTGFGFCVARGMERMEYTGMDSTLALAINGSHWVVRYGASEWQRVADNVFVSSWNEGLETCIKTYLCVMGPWHVRVHRIHTGSSIEAADGGYSVPDPLTKFVDDKRRVYTSNASKHLFAAAVSMDGTGKAAECKPPENSNLMHPRVKVPYIFRAFEPGMHLWLNAFYGGAEEPCEIPVVSVEKNKVVMTLGNRKAECIIDETQVSSSDQVFSPPAESVAQKVLSFFLRRQ